MFVLWYYQSEIRTVDRRVRRIRNTVQIRSHAISFPAPIYTCYRYGNRHFIKHFIVFIVETFITHLGISRALQSSNGIDCIDN